MNNLIASNAGNGAAIEVNGGSLSATYNLFWQNTDSDADVSLNASNPLVDPVFTGTPVGGGVCDTSVLVPGTNSPAIDGGDPALTDSDGTRIDIGAFTDLVGTDQTDGDDDDGDGIDSPFDCDDTDPAIFPGQLEILCDGIDQDCDASTPDDQNADGDEWSVCEGDCDDNDPTFTFPFDVYFDGDGDGYGVGETTTEECEIPPHGSLINGDCDDDDPLTYPGAIERGDLVDNDCDGSVVADNDGDGAAWPNDCDDFNKSRYPGAEDIPGDGLDQDCNGWDAEDSFTGGSGVTCGGCVTQGPTGGAGWLGIALLLVRRRRNP